MQITLLIHVLAGALGLVTGYTALAVAKGAPLHRRAGMVFVYVMVTMSMTGLLVSASRGIAPAINIPTALLTFYFVITGMTTLRQAQGGPERSRGASVSSPAGWSRRLQVAGMVFAVALGVGCLVLAVSSIGRGGAAAGMAYPLVMFGAVALAAGNGDRRLIRDGALKGAPRLMRHVWRMCFALFVSSIAFYLGPDRLPEALQSPAFRATGVLIPIAAIGYWKWRLRAKRPVREIVRISAPEAI
jgi:uncharacterized membrane protein